MPVLAGWSCHAPWPILPTAQIFLGPASCPERSSYSACLACARAGCMCKRGRVTLDLPVFPFLYRFCAKHAMPS